MLIQAFWWLMTIFMVTGAILNAKAMWHGFVFWIVANIAMFSKAVYVEDWPQAALWAIYTVISSVGLISWRKKRG